MLGSTKLALAVSAARTKLREATQIVNAADEPTAEQMTAMNEAEGALTETEKRHGALLRSEAALERTAASEFSERRPRRAERASATAGGDQHRTLLAGCRRRSAGFGSGSGVQSGP